MGIVELPDLDQTSVFDIVERNFERLKLKTYAIRLVYVGEHTRSKEDIIEHFQSTLVGVNKEYCEVNVNGLLLVYDSYFIHIVEGSEDTLHKHLRFLFSNEVQWAKDMDIAEGKAKEALKEPHDSELSITTSNMIKAEKESLVKSYHDMERRWFRRLKMLTIYHSISTLMFTDWKALPARPPSLIGTLDIHAPLAFHLEQLKICLDKLRRLSVLATTEKDLSFEGLSFADPKIDTLPPVTLVDFLLESPHMLDLLWVHGLHRKVDDYIYYFEEVWPLPSHFTPRYLYKLTIDDSFVEPLPVMPWEKAKREIEDDDEEHIVSDSSG